MLRLTPPNKILFAYFVSAALPYFYTPTGGTSSSADLLSTLAARGLYLYPPNFESSTLKNEKQKAPVLPEASLF